MFLIALAVEGDESAIIFGAQLQQRPGCGQQRRRLIVVAVKRAESPAQARNRDCGPEARADRVFRDAAARKMRGAEAGGEGQPGERFEFVVEEEGCQTAGSGLRIGERWTSTIRGIGIAVSRAIEENAQTLIVILMESVKANLEIVPVEVCGKACLTPRIGRRVTVGRGGGVVVRIALVVRDVPMKEGRECQEQFRIEGVNPGSIDQSIRLVISVTKAAAIELRALQIVEIWVIRNLVIVFAQR